MKRRRSQSIHYFNPFPWEMMRLKETNMFILEFTLQNLVQILFSEPRSFSKAILICDWSRFLCEWIGSSTTTQNKGP